MDDDEIIARGGTQEDIDKYAHDNGACGLAYSGTCSDCSPPNTKSQADNTELGENLDRIFGQLEHYEILAEGNSVDTRTAKERTKELFAKFLKEQDIKSRIDEWQTVLEAKITHGGSPAPFNPEGLPISTPATEQMTELLHQHAQNRLTELRSKA